MRIGENINFENYARQQAEHEAQLVFTPGHWVEDLAQKLVGGDCVSGSTLPWTKTVDNVRLRPGELSLWAGYSGHKKSMLLGQVVMHLAKSHVVSIASLEMHPSDTLWRMCRQCFLTMPTTDQLGDFLKWTDSRMVIYDQLDKVAWNRIIGFVYYCAKELGSEHIVIDSLTKCGISQGDGEAEKDFIDRLQWAAKTLKTHIHLVCHVRKPHAGSEEPMPTKYDVRGVSEITDLADNVFIVFKDRKKEDLKNKQKNTRLSISESEYLVNPDQILNVVKQRHGDWEGRVRLWFNERSLQFTGEENFPMAFDFKDDLSRERYVKINETHKSAA